MPQTVRPDLSRTLIAFALLSTFGCDNSGSTCASKRDCPNGQDCVAATCRPRSYEPAPANDASFRDPPDSATDASEPAIADASIADTSIADASIADVPRPLPSRCASDTDCQPPDFVCEQAQCIRGCAHPGGIQCSGATQCDPSTGRCAAETDFCTRDSDCAPPSTVCNLLNGACEAGCTAASCTAPSTCSAATGRCAGACPLDPFEENDTSAAAQLSPTHVEAGLWSCLGDDDYHSLFLTLNDAATIEVIAGIAEGDIDVEIFGPDGLLAGGSHAVGGGETFTYVARATGVHILRIYLVTDTGSRTGSEYALDVQVALAPCADAFEPNDALSSAAIAAPGPSHPDLSVCTAQDDWFIYPLLAGERIDVNLDFNDAEGDIDVSLLNADETILASALSNDDDESFSYVAPADGDYYLHVFLYSEAGTQRGNAYTMSVSTTQSPAASGCNDLYEPNNASSSASPISAGNYPALGVCTGDEDYYRLALTAGAQLDIQVLFSQPEGDIDTVLLNAAGSIVASSAGVVSNEHIAYAVPASGDYFLRVYLYRDAGSTPGNAYALAISY